MRPSLDESALELAAVGARRATCGRKQVGCVLFDHYGHIIGSGYNGPASGQAHCTESPCPGMAFDNGEGLEYCEAIHAEANALLDCRDIRQILTCYVTASPCLHCVKLLLNTSCQRIVFRQPFTKDYDLARERWTKVPIGINKALHHSVQDVFIYRTWEQLP